ncbi:MAG TPA: hypothetical protein VEM15_03520 [Thermodesulfobacteriota bacterium]|nr:hypothetical protein [Thermodesulfobacteriota bacterium]
MGLSSPTHPMILLNGETMGHIATVIEILKEEGIRNRFKVMVGSGPISQGFADRIGADGHARNASQAAKLAGK